MRQNTFFVRALLAAVLATGTVLPSPTPAGADHTDFYTHWGHDYRPFVNADCAAFGGSLCTHTQAAEQFWIQQGFWGFRGNQPWWGCAHFKGWITVCGKTRAEYPSFRPVWELGTQGVMFPIYTENPTRHLDSAVIFVCTDCFMGPSEVANVVKHEYGHAIGLGHTLQAPSIMTARISSSAANAHDHAAVRSMYTRHDNTLSAGRWLDSWDEERLLSTDGRFRAIMQRDGNFVAYGQEGVLFATGTNGWPNVRAVMQHDCNLVLYSNQIPIWASNTDGWGGGCRLIMQSDSNLVIYTSWGQPVWAIW